MNANNEVHIPVIREGEEKKASEIVFPDKNKKRTRPLTKKQKALTLLNSFVDDAGIEQQELADLMCVTPSIVCNYLNGRRFIPPDHLSAFCIALRIAPARQRYLFCLMRIVMPDEHGDNADERETIIRRYMDFCPSHDNADVRHCNRELVDADHEPLTEKGMRGKRHG